MKTYIVVVYEQVAYAISANKDDNQIEELKSNRSYADCLFVTTHASELLTTPKLADTCRAKLLDLECLDKEIRQSLTYVDTHCWKWNEAEMVKYYLDRDLEGEEKQIEKILPIFKECFCKMKDLGKDEWERIEKIEIPINSLLYKSQRKGFFVNHEAVKAECEKCYTEMYHLRNKIQIEYGQVTPNVQQFMLDHDISQWAIDHYKRKILARRHPELNDYSQLEKAERDFKSLIYMSSFAENRNCQPQYKGFGSSTGRIMMREPALQNLKRDYRIFLKDSSLEDKEYLYVDYSQFEAGILAGITDNKKLIDLYNNGDIYDKLKSLTNVDRDMAKTYFYCFVYGGFVADGAKTFFDEYCPQADIDKIMALAQKEGMVCSPLGNVRKLNPDGDNKWVVNHLIQSTSSLIFKEALLDVERINHFGKIQLIMPMHDAALYLVDSEDEGINEEIRKQFVAAFKNRFPKINPIVKFKDYFKGE